jgi:putative ABC transport system permease protein
MRALWSELGDAARRLARRPGYLTVAVATLALGIGGATSIFSVADAVLLRPLPYAEPERLAVVWQRDLKRDQPILAISYPAYQDWRDHNQVFDELAAMGETNQDWTLTGRGEPVAIPGRLVTANFFGALRVPPLVGRALQPNDDRLGAIPVVVLSHALWRGRFSEDPSILGQSLILNGRPHTVVGVMPPAFAYPPQAQLWMPLVPGAGATTVESGAINWMIAVGRVKPGVSPEAARTELSALTVRYLRGIVERHNLQGIVDPEGYSAVVTPLPDALLGPTRAVLLALLGTVGLVLMIACANVAGLLLVRALERSHEMAVRLTLGASTARLAQGFLAESLLLAGIGGAAGILAAHLGVPALVRLSPQDIPRLPDADVDARVLGMALLAAIVTALLAGLAPMLLLRKVSLQETLRERSRSVAEGRNRLRSTLVVCEVAMSVVLLVGAGLLARSFLALRSVPLGFQPERVLSVGAWAPQARYPTARQWRVFYREFLRRVQSVPGVEAAATVSVRPLSGPTGWDFPFTVEGQSEAQARANPMVNLQAVSTDYFRVMGMSLKRGRAFEETDAEGRPGVVVVSESLARYSWPGQDPIGKRLKVPQWESPYHEAWLSVVGVVGDARYRGLSATRLDLYMSDLQSDHPTGSVMVRTQAEPVTVAALVREAVWSLDRDQAPPTVITMTGAVSEALTGPRFATRVCGAFAAVALLLAALGLYGLVAYSVTTRTREIGVRVALGAGPRALASTVLGEGLRSTAWGVGLGFLVAWASTRLLEALLFGVTPTDGVTFAVVAGVLLAVSLLACALPLRRALAVDPALALRHD